MPMSPSTWGAAVASAVAGLTVPQTTIMTAGDLTTFWTAITTEHVTHISTFMTIAGTTGVGVPGGPLPLTTPPVTVT